MIFIDWISPKEHANFNFCFFEALNLSDESHYVFAPELILEKQNSSLVFCNNGRFERALKVFKICWKYKKEPIFLLSYDSLLVPILQIFCKNVSVFEHNTTPEGDLYFKHAIWQKLFFRTLLRFTQFPSQQKVLETMKQKCVYLGSPLRKAAATTVRDQPSIYIAPSDRLTLDELYKVRDIVGNDKVIIRRSHFSDDHLKEIKKTINIQPTTYIDFDINIHKIKAIIIAVPSDLRGSGWFTEAIMYNIPLIITSEGMQKIFEKTFPDYPYIAPSLIKNSEELGGILASISSFANIEYIEQHNVHFKTIFNENNLISIEY